MSLVLKLKWPPLSRENPADRLKYSGFNRALKSEPHPLNGTALCLFIWRPFIICDKDKNLGFF
jgi:hypothetical protein